MYVVVGKKIEQYYGQSMLLDGGNV